MPTIYTSRYANPELASGKYTVVGITRGAPKFSLQYTLAGNIIEIAPPWNLFNVYDRILFTEPYFCHMNKIGVKRVKGSIYSYFGFGKDIVLCCYEDVRKPNEWCHRLVFAEWWKMKTDEVIEELSDPSPNPYTKSKTPITVNKNSPFAIEHSEQISLFQNLF